MGEDSPLPVVHYNNLLLCDLRTENVAAKNTANGGYAVRIILRH